MIDRASVWTGTINDVSQPLSSSTVRFYDTTLRDGEQSVGVVINSDEKLQIAKLIDSLGISRIEAGFPRVSADDRKAIEKILEAGLQAEIWGFSRAVPADVDAIIELGLHYTVIEAPISDLKLQALNVTRTEMLRRIHRAVSFAAQKGVKVAFFGVDGSRSDLDFYQDAYRTALEAGASELVAVDTLGIANPEAVKHLVRLTRDVAGPSIPVHFHGHNDFGVATANALAAVEAGAAWIQGTINGMGERAGNANIPEIALALEALYRTGTELKVADIWGVSRKVQELCGYTLEPWKPLVGENLFRRETGTVASQFHHPPAIEPYASSLVGQTRSIVLGKKSGLDSIRIKCTELGLQLDSERYPELLQMVKDLGVRKQGLVSNEEFSAMADKVAQTQD